MFGGFVTYNNRKAKIKRGSFKISTTNAFNSFFREDNGFPKDVYIPALAEMRTEVLGTEKVQSMVDALYDIVTDEVMISWVSGRNEEEFRKLAGAIQIVSYQDAANFDYILFFNPSTYDARAFDFPHGDVGSNLKHIYKEMLQEDMSVSISVDAANNGFGVSLL